MPNFTITRQTEPLDDYGCTEFETNQIVGDTASLLSSATLDGSIIWYLDASNGYTVNVNDFNISGTNPTTVLQIPGLYRTFEGSGIPSPVLGIVFDQISTTRIKITLYLHPISTHGITGAVFTMPNNSVSANINITGCPVLVGHGVHLRVENNGPVGEVEVTASVSSDVDTIKEQEEGNPNVVAVIGHVLDKDINEELCTYTITTKNKERFVTEPVISMSTDDHFTTSSTTKDDLGNIISTTIKVFKQV